MEENRESMDGGFDEGIEMGEPPLPSQEEGVIYDSEEEEREGKEESRASNTLQEGEGRIPNSNKIRSRKSCPPSNNQHTPYNKRF